MGKILEAQKKNQVQAINIIGFYQNESHDIFSVNW